MALDPARQTLQDHAPYCTTGSIMLRTCSSFLKGLDQRHVHMPQRGLLNETLRQPAYPTWPSSLHGRPGPSESRSVLMCSIRRSAFDATLADLSRSRWLSIDPRRRALRRPGLSTVGRGSTSKPLVDLPESDTARVHATTGRPDQYNQNNCHFTSRLMV